MPNHLIDQIIPKNITYNNLTSALTIAMRSTHYLNAINIPFVQIHWPQVSSSVWIKPNHHRIKLHHRRHFKHIIAAFSGLYSNLYRRRYHPTIPFFVVVWISLRVVYVSSCLRVNTASAKVSVHIQRVAICCMKKCIICSERWLANMRTTKSVGFCVWPMRSKKKSQ